MNTENNQQLSDYQQIELAIAYLESNFREQPSLDEIASVVHLSKYHFQRLFKRWAGISPTQFLQFLTIEYAKHQLVESRTVLQSSLDAGLSGPGRLHDMFVNHEAITPGQYRKQGKGLEINYGIHSTPFGQALIAMTSRGICALRFLDQKNSQLALDLLAKEWPKAHLKSDQINTASQMKKVFGSINPDERRPFHLYLKGTNFQIQVWRALLTLPTGYLVSYQQVAELIGRPSATRAVASAIAQNPIGFLIPCHRVINKNGRYHNYRWGSTRKKAIIAWEAAQKIGEGNLSHEYP
jgi:AraC family transcriptional regulator of adaptative response/methylated-DNA-[protein]-cysteine methyltransferase